MSCGTILFSALRREPDILETRFKKPRASSAHGSINDRPDDQIVGSRNRNGDQCHNIGIAGFRSRGRKRCCIDDLPTSENEQRCPIVVSRQPEFNLRSIAPVALDALDAKIRRCRRNKTRKSHRRRNLRKRRRRSPGCRRRRSGCRFLRYSRTGRYDNERQY